MKPEIHGISQFQNKFHNKYKFVGVLCLSILQFLYKVDAFVLLLLLLETSVDYSRIKITNVVC